MTVTAETKRIVWDRAGGLCERVLADGKRCSGPGAEIHHIKLKGMGGRKGEMKEKIDALDNLLLVCLQCHRERHEGKGWKEKGDGLWKYRNLM